MRDARLKIVVVLQTFVLEKRNFYKYYKLENWKLWKFLKVQSLKWNLKILEIDEKLKVLEKKMKTFESETFESL